MSVASVGALSGSRFLIEDIYPSVDGGRFPIKRVAGEPVEVWADIIRDGHDELAADLLWRRQNDTQWQRVPLQFRSNDRWAVRFTPETPGRYVFAIEAWTDLFGTWRRDFLRKRDAGINVDLELKEGRALLGRLRPSRRSSAESTSPGAAMLEKLSRQADSAELEAILDQKVAEAAARIQAPDVTRSVLMPLIIDRPRARAGAWYEMVPRSQSSVAGQHGTFDDAIARLDDIADLGFDVVYLTPIHPIGRTNRKGRNNALRAEAGDPGSPYAIGAAEGGHDAVHPELGSLEDFRRFVDACAQRDMEVALDFAVQCSPDHPWLKEHPDWFSWRPDGTMRYAENPPKKYEDIVNPDFYCADSENLWKSLRDVVLFWVRHGVRIFRVDNPHTKPFPFWEWLIREVQAVDPNVIFLSEAFTRPKVMKALAKLGFTQSYTYFTWRTGKEELQAYLSEITAHPEREYFRPNFFTNTPDILPFHLQTGEPWIFKSRFALAATLSGNYGIYNGFELLEHEPIAGKEEYLNSEKYEIKTRDWDKPGNIKTYIKRLNRIRRENSALQQTANLRFATVDRPEVTGFVKESADRSNAIAAAVVLGKIRGDFWFHFGDMEIGPDGQQARVREIENLFTGERHLIEWGGVRLWIDAEHEPALLFRCYT